MTIKDVEKLTGLTAKSIRYYEQKGLLTVERNEENSYRSYSETEVNRLKKIKLLRYLDFSIEEIKNILNMETGEVVETLQQKSEAFSKQSDKCKEKQSLCLAFMKDYKKHESNHDEIVSEYNQFIEFMESGEMGELEEELLDYAAPSLSATIGITLICSGPILWLFINIQEGMLDKLMWNAVMAILGTVLATWGWIRYITERRKDKERVKKKNHQHIWILPTMIAAIILGLAAHMVLFSTTERLLAPEDFLFYEYHPVARTVMIWLTMIFVILILLLVVAKIMKKTRKEMDQMNDILFLWNALGKFKPVAFILWFIGLYCCLTSVNFVTEETIICHSPIQPMGVRYSYSDVEKITTGFGDSTFVFVEYKKKGNFFYQLELDGKTITFHQPMTNEEIKRFDEDSYLELEEFDQRLMGFGIPKKGSSAGSENCLMDQVYIDRFIRITENK